MGNLTKDLITEDLGARGGNLTKDLITGFGGEGW